MQFDTRREVNSRSSPMHGCPGWTGTLGKTERHKQDMVTHHSSLGNVQQHMDHSSTIAQHDANTILHEGPTQALMIMHRISDSLPNSHSAHTEEKHPPSQKHGAPFPLAEHGTQPISESPEIGQSSDRPLTPCFLIPRTSPAQENTHWLLKGWETRAVTDEIRGDEDN